MNGEAGAMDRVRRPSAWVAGRLGLLAIAFAIIAFTAIVDAVLSAEFWVAPIPIPVVVMAAAFFVTVRSRSPWLALAIALPAIGLAAWTAGMSGSGATFGQQVAARANVSAALEALLSVGAGTIAGVVWLRRTAGGGRLAPQD